MGCVFRARLNSLWSIWYTIIFLLIQIYLLYLGFERYRLYTDMKWPHGAYPHTWLTIYISLYAACIPLCLLFVAFGVFKSGNLAGDNDQLSARTERILEITGPSRNSCCLRFLKSLWLHGPPLPQTIHVILAICQLFAQQVMLAQLYRFGFINSGDFLNTELDFLYQRARQLATNLPMGDTRLQSFRLTTDELAGSPLAPNILPVLMHARLFGIPLEFVNFVIALITFSCSYPAVFWRVNKAFSLWFSIHFIFYIADSIFTYLEFCILFRIQETNHHSIRPIGLGAHLSGLSPKIIFHPVSVIAEYLVTIVLMHLGPVILYSYGYQKYFVAVKTLQNKNRERAQNAVGDDYGEIRRQRGDHSVNDLCCNGYGSNVIALLYLVATAAAKLPAIIGTVNLYEHDQKPILLTCFAVNAAYLFSWLIFWLGFTIKGHWEFKILYRVQEFLNIQSAHKLGFGTIAGKAPSELKNALIMMQGDHMYVTDDPLAKQSLMRHALKTNTHDEVYWLRGNQSPTTRKAIIEDGKGTPEMTRLLGPSVRRQSSGNNPLIGNQSPTILTYHHPNRSLRGGLPPQPPPSMVNYADDQMMQQNFGTLQRNQYGPGMRAINLQSATLGRPHHPESYASINKNAALINTPNAIQRRGSQNRGDNNIENVTYGNNALYSTYARAPQNIHYMPPQTPTNPIYGTYATQQRQSSEPIHSGITENGIGSVKASPLLNDKKLNNTPRDLTYQRLGNLSSFNTSNQNRPQVNARLPPTGLSSQQPQQTNVIYKPTISASSSQQDSCFTPVSSTSQGSAGNFSSHTPTASSPIASARFNGTNSQIYGRIDHETRGGSEPHNSNIYGTQTLTKSSLSTGSTSKIGVTPLRMPIKSTTVSITRHHDDSANYSLSSSNDSADKKITTNNFNPEYATSVV